MHARQTAMLVASLAVVLILAAPVMALLHAVIPHHDHGSSLHTDLWDGLQGSLSRRDAVTLDSPSLASFTSALLWLFAAAFLIPFVRASKNLSELEALRRGIVRYRAFP